jgi:YgiT-type zinc finger domain-containing protein
MNKDYVKLDTRGCNECQAGQMHPKGAALFTWLGEEMVIVSDFPCWVCDICGRREYDLKALTELNLLLSPNAGTPTASHRRIVRPPDLPDLRPGRTH